MARVLRRPDRASRAALLCLAVAVALPAASALARDRSPSHERSVPPAAGAASAGFVPNRGQLPTSTAFAAGGAGYSFAFERDRVRLSLAGDKKATQLALRFVGARAASLEGAGRQPATVSYFRGHDPSRWLTGLPTYSTVAYRNVWRGIDVLFTLRSGKLKYEFVVRPGARVADIRLAYDGARLSLDERGNLRIATAGGVLNDERPTTYQRIDGERVAVASRYVLTPGSYGFTVGSYDRRSPLIVDPGLAYSTFLGGSSFDGGLGIAVDANGSAYVTGRTSSIDFPGPGTNVGSGDVFVAKLTPDGSGLVYTAFLGGGGLDEGRGIAVDSAGNAYVAGFTRSPDFPAASAADPTYNGALDGFFAKLDPSGSRLLVSTYLGGARDDRALAVEVDAGGNAHVTGETSSDDFPVTPGAFDTKQDGDFDVFVTKIQPAGPLAYSTFLGGPQLDHGLAITVGPNGNAYVTGKGGVDFPTTNGAYDRSPNGDLDAFVAQLTSDGSDLVYSTYLGGEGWDEGLGIGVDGNGDAYVTGNGQSPDFPTTAGAWDSQLSGSVDGFVTKLSSDASGLVYSTFLGGSDWDEPDGLAVDDSGRVYVTGHLASSDFPTTDGAFDPTYNGVVEGFVTVVDPSGGDLAYSSYLGGSDWDAGFALAIDTSGAAYITGYTESADFPTSAQPFDGTENGDVDAYVTKLEPFASPPPPPPPPPPPSPNFSLVASPAIERVVAGESATYTVTIVPIQGFADEVVLDVAGLPDGATASFTPNPATAESTLTVETTQDTPPNLYTLTITGTSDSIASATTVLLNLHCCPDPD